MTRHGGLCNTYHTLCNSIGTYDMVQENVPLRASFIIQEGNYLQALFQELPNIFCPCDNQWVIRSMICSLRFEIAGCELESYPLPNLSPLELDFKVEYQT